MRRQDSPQGLDPWIHGEAAYITESYTCWKTQLKTQLKALLKTLLKTQCNGISLFFIESIIENTIASIDQGFSAIFHCPGPGLAVNIYIVDRRPE